MSMDVDVDLDCESYVASCESSCYDSTCASVCVRALDQQVHATRHGKRKRAQRRHAEQAHAQQVHATRACGASHAHAKKGGWGAVCAPRVFCASKNPSFLARWRVRGPAGTGSVGDSVGEGALDRGTGTSREEAEEEEGL